MKIDRPTIWTPPEPVQEKTSTRAPGKAVEEKSAEPVELQRNPSPKTDSVEINQNSNVILDNIASRPKLDPSQSPNAKEVPAALIPGIPFREKVELPKTLPNGTSVDSGVGSGDLGFGKTRPGPNHMGIDLKAGGVDIKNQLDDALKLREGSGTPSSSGPSGGTIDYTGLGSPPKTQPKYDAGFNRPGMSMISAEPTTVTTTDPRKPLEKLKDQVKELVGEAVDEFRRKVVDKYVPIPGANDLIDAPKTVEKVTGDAVDLMRGADAVLNPEKRLDKILDASNDKKYVNPDAPEGTQPPVITDESLEKVGVRLGSNTQPGVEEHLQEIDGSQLSETDPRRQLISNPNPDDQSSITGGTGHVILDAKGPDTVNPNDPELGGGGEPIVLDPNRPR